MSVFRELFKYFEFNGFFNVTSDQDEEKNSDSDYDDQDGEENYDDEEEESDENWFANLDPFYFEKLI